MAHFTVTRDVIRRISEIETPHACVLNEDITDEFPDERTLVRNPMPRNQTGGKSSSSPV